MDLPPNPHIVYETPPPAIPCHGHLRVSRDADGEVFVSKWHSTSATTGEYHDTTLSERSLKMLRDLAPWLWRPGMKLEYRYELRSSSLLAAHGGAIALTVKIHARNSEDLAWEAEQGQHSCPYEITSTLCGLNRAREWVQYGFREALSLQILHNAWASIISDMADEASEFDRAEIHAMPYFAAERRKAALRALLSANASQVS